MTGPDVSISLPESDTPGELIKGYFTLMRAFGWDLYVTCHFALKDELGQNWFPARISALKLLSPAHWKPQAKFEPQDPGVILRDYAHEPDSPYLAVFGGAFQKVSAAKKILATRNTWFHFGDDPTVNQLAETAKTVRGFVVSSGMHIGQRIDALITRLNDVGTGRYPAHSGSTTNDAPVAASDSGGVEPPGDVEFEVPADLPRPSIGGTWTGPIPDHRYRITRTNDIVDPDTIESVRSRVTGDFSERFRAWTAVEPRGREVWIDDTDGAIGGYIGASPRLLGYLGPDPEGEIARGFFTPHYYTFDGDEVVDLDTNQRLTVPFTSDIENGATLRVTTYGDVLALDDSAGIERVAVVNRDQWFPGHLKA